VATTPAELFLLEALGDGEAHPSTEVEAAANARGISRSAYDRARRKLNVIAIKDGVRGSWSMQLEATPAKQAASVHTLYPPYALATCTHCDYSVLNAITDYPRRCHCGGTLHIQQAPTTAPLTSRAFHISRQ
jgi:hypothetical protein